MAIGTDIRIHSTLLAGAPYFTGSFSGRYAY